MTNLKYFFYLIPDSATYVANDSFILLRLTCIKKCISMSVQKNVKFAGVSSGMQIFMFLIDFSTRNKLSNIFEDQALIWQDICDRIQANALICVLSRIVAYDSPKGKNQYDKIVFSYIESILIYFFILRYNMKTHCNTHHRDQEEPKLFKCLICSESFIRIEKLNEHLKAMHDAAIGTSPTALNVN